MSLPYRPYWLQRLPEIIETLKSLSNVTIDRRTFESIFRLRRRRAIELMHVLGSYRARRGFVLDRYALLEKLQSLATVAHYGWERQVRFPRVVEQLSQAEGDASNGSDGVRRRIHFEFIDQDELIEKLLAALYAATEGGLCRGVEQGGRSGRDHQYEWFEQAIRAFQDRNLGEARRLFAQASIGPDQRIRTSAEAYLRICKHRTEEEWKARSLEEHYAYGVILLNERRLPEARAQFEAALHIDPCADYIYYCLAACLALSRDIAGVHSNLMRAIELRPFNRIAAQCDPDFSEALEDPVVRQLMNQR